MAVNFSLTRKTTKEIVVLSKLDDELRTHFNEPASKDSWLAGWFNSIGIYLALGKSWEEIKIEFSSNEGLLAIASYIEEHFIVSSWRS